MGYPLTHLLVCYKKRQKNFQAAHTLFNEGKSKQEISQRLKIRKPTIIAWLRKKQYTEGRGWKHGRRTYSDTEEERIVFLKREMITRDDYLLGAPYVQMHYAERHAPARTPSVWFIKDVVRRHGLQTREPKKRTRGKNIVARLLFPIQSIIQLGRIQQSIDFIGKKFITGRTEPISIFATSYYQWFELYRIWRVLAETAPSAITCLLTFWQRFPIPDAVRCDNATLFRGGGTALISGFLKFLLRLNITPLFSAPYQSYTNPHIEGHNSTFAQKLWAKHIFTNEADIDRECDRFNGESERFFRWKFKERLRDQHLRYVQPDYPIDRDPPVRTRGKKICFIRFAQLWPHGYGIVVLNRFVPLPEAYNNQYVFVELRLDTAMLHVLSEREGITLEILRILFPFQL